MTSEFLKTLLAPDMAEVDRVLRASLDSDVALIRQVAEYIIGGGGKRLRPALVLLSARACGYDGAAPLHAGGGRRDDPHGDAAARRRRRRIEAAPRPRDGQRDVRQRRVGAGRRLSLLARVPADGRASARCACWRSCRDATNVIAEGEVLQLMNSGNPDLDEAAYLDVIQRKTAKLFEAAAQLGAVLGGAPPEREAALARYGMHLGTSFQLVDDVLDYSGDRERDRQEPRRRSRRRQDDAAADPRDRGRQRRRRRADPRRDHRRRLTDFAPVMDVLARTGALDYARALRRCARARPRPPAWPACRLRRTGENLLELASFAARRTY